MGKQAGSLFPVRNLLARGRALSIILDMEMVLGKIALVTILCDHWNRYLAWKARNGEFVRPAVIEHVNRVLSCRTPRLGAHLYRCPNCNLIKVVPHSCHSPFCNSCGTARSQDWGARVLSEMLDVPYRHLVFSLPWELRLPARDNRERLLSAVMRGAAESVLALTRGDPEPLGFRGRERMAAARKRYTPGIQAALHTFGSQLNWHVHVHLLVTAGGLSDTGEWVAAPLHSLVSTAELATEFKLRVIRAFEAEDDAYPLFRRRLRGDRRRRVDLEAVLGKTEGMRWKVYVGPTLEDPSHALKYCARYTRRPAIGEARLVRYDGNRVTFHYKDYYHGKKRAYKTLDALVFLDRLLQHIPEKGARPFLSYGIFAPRVKTERLAQARRSLRQRKRRDPKPRTWEMRRREHGDPHPLQCPRCKVRMEHFMDYFGEHERVAELTGTAVDQRIAYPTYVEWGHFLAHG